MPLVLDLRPGTVKSRWVSNKQLFNELWIAFKTSFLRSLVFKDSREGGGWCCWLDDIDAEIQIDGGRHFLDFVRMNLRKEDDERDEGFEWLIGMHFGLRVLDGFKTPPIQFWAIFFSKATNSEL